MKRVNIITSIAKNSITFLYSLPFTPVLTKPIEISEINSSYLTSGILFEKNYLQREW